MSHISSKLFLSDLSKAFLKCAHSCFSSASTILKEGTVLPITAEITYPASIFAKSPSQSSNAEKVLDATINSKEHLGERGLAKKLWDDIITTR